MRLQILTYLKFSHSLKHRIYGQQLSTHLRKRIFFPFLSLSSLLWQNSGSLSINDRQLFQGFFPPSKTRPSLFLQTQNTFGSSSDENTEVLLAFYSTCDNKQQGTILSVSLNWGHSYSFYTFIANLRLRVIAQHSPCILGSLNKICHPKPLIYFPTNLYQVIILDNGATNHFQLTVMETFRHRNYIEFHMKYPMSFSTNFSFDSCQ